MKMPRGTSRSKSFMNVKLMAFIMMEFLGMVHEERGLSSSGGVVKATSQFTGKAIDVEIMSKEYQECMGWKDRPGVWHLMNGGKAVKLFDMLIELAFLVQWMPLVCLLFSRGPSKIIPLVMLSF